MRAVWEKRRAEDCPPYLTNPVTPEEEIDAVVQQIPEKEEQ